MGFEPMVLLASSVGIIDAFGLFLKILFRPFKGTNHYSVYSHYYHLETTVNVTGWGHLQGHYLLSRILGPD
jgi:hypothetical protein